MRKRIIISIVIILTFFLGGATNYLIIRELPLPTQEVQKVITEYKIEETATFEAIDKIYDAVVVVETFNNEQSSSSGTGFVYKKDDKKGYIITNNHVVTGADKVEIILTSGERVSATVLGSDDIGDIAVLSIPADKVIKVAEIGNTKNTKVGSTVFAIGAPMGSEYSGTTTRGCVSAKDRMVSFSLSDIGSNDILMRVIQTDAAINPGNSGGPLINLAGEVIGVTSLKLVQEQIEGIGFAIPIEDALKHMDLLEKGEKIKRPVLGVQLLDLDEVYALFYSNIYIDEQVKTGAVIQSVLADTSASEAGLRKGDVILQVGDVKVEDKAELRYELYKYSAGDKIKIIYYRDGKTENVEVILKSSDE
ncbi:MAG: trypsin-like peptidase domain-containing protein [Bacilli bacterium]|nr:trypsin-like peptidase domain-containing protein [Bacilli bacterium]